VLSLSYWDHKVTLQLPEGKTMTSQANPNVNLGLVNVGDAVSVQVVEARTFAVEKSAAPAP
jgi:hypothetical protein